MGVKWGGVQGGSAIFQSSLDQLGRPIDTAQAIEDLRRAPQDAGGNNQNLQVTCIQF